MSPRRNVVAVAGVLTLRGSGFFVRLVQPAMRNTCRTPLRPDPLGLHDRGQAGFREDMSQLKDSFVPFL